MRTLFAFIYVLSLSGFFLVDLNSRDFRGSAFCLTSALTAWKFAVSLSFHRAFTLMLWSCGRCFFLFKETGLKLSFFGSSDTGMAPDAGTALIQGPWPDNKPSCPLPTTLLGLFLFSMPAFWLWTFFLVWLSYHQCIYRSWRPCSSFYWQVWYHSLRTSSTGPSSRSLLVFLSCWYLASFIIQLFYRARYRIPINKI